MKLYVGNLPFSATESDVRELFEKHGTVDEVTLITDRDTGRPRGFGFVEMSEGGQAARLRIFWRCSEVLMCSSDETLRLHVKQAAAAWCHPHVMSEGLATPRPLEWSLQRLVPAIRHGAQDAQPVPIVSSCCDRERPARRHSDDFRI